MIAIGSGFVSSGFRALQSLLVYCNFNFQFFPDLPVYFPREPEGGNSNSLQLSRAKEESSQGASTSSPSSSSTPRWKYKKGILTFRDDKELKRGKSISSELLKAIEESRNKWEVLDKSLMNTKNALKGT
ncbi:hypothetical protein CMV_012069 [Castanea mollissima]|uniref:TIR domain-containing protein n=1 Tax=Castanea mollissima TaxID=60419 RepID=A0A8J4R2R4_9ROSI|nr:hypothetical protein CMV_012069 [Castanea mollissima]